jgi:hypothetical protein
LQAQGLRKDASFTGFWREWKIVRAAAGFGDCGIGVILGKWNAGKKHDGKKYPHSVLRMGP